MADLVPFNSVKVFLGLPDNDTGSEVITLQMIAGLVSDRFSTYVGYQLLTHITTEIKTPDGNDIFLNEKPIQSIMSFRFGYDYDWDSQPEVRPDEYYLDAQNGIIFMKATPLGMYRNCVRVSYVAGYTQSNMPDSIRRAYYAQVRHEWMNKNQFGHTKITNNDGGSVDVVGFNLLPDVRYTLDQYRRLV